MKGVLSGGEGILVLSEEGDGFFEAREQTLSMLLRLVFSLFFLCEVDIEI